MDYIVWIFGLAKKTFFLKVNIYIMATVAMENGIWINNKEKIKIRIEKCAKRQCKI